MRCPATSEFWRDDIQRDPTWAAHLATCAVCRMETARVGQLQQLLAEFPQLDTPDAVQTQLAQLAAEVGAQRYTCAETLPLLEAWRESALDAAQMFLVEEHLLACDPCARALEQSEQLSTLMSALPALSPPAVIAERLARAREPWWRRWLMPAPAPSWQWGRVLSYSSATMAAGVVLAILLLHSGGQQALQLASKPPAVPSYRAMVMPAPAHLAPSTESATPATPSDGEETTPSAPLPVAPAVVARHAEVAAGPSQPSVVFISYDREAPRMPAAKSLPGFMSVVGPASSDVRRPHGDTPIISSATPDTAEAFVPPAFSTDERSTETPTVSAQDAMRRMAREDELASSEESLSDVQLAAAPSRTEMAPAMVVDNGAPTTPTDEINRAFSRERQQWATPKLTPIVVRNDRGATRGDGLKILIK